MRWLHRLLFEEHGWGKIWTGLAMATALAGGGLIYQQTRPSTGCAFPACFPDATNTGVPSGTSLTAYSGPTTISTNGTVIDSKDITSCLVVDATGVIIRKSRSHVSCFFSIEVSGAAGGSLTIEDSEIDCLSTGETGLAIAHTTVTRVNIHHCENGVDIENFVTVQDSYIHDLDGPPPDPHIDGIQASWGADSTIQHNTILSRDTSSIIITNYNDHPSVDNVLITQNKMGAQTSASVANVLYCPGVASTNFRVIDNRFLSQFPPVGDYATGCQATNATTSGNLIYETSVSLDPLP